MRSNIKYCGADKMLNKINSFLQPNPKLLDLRTQNTYLVGGIVKTILAETYFNDIDIVVPIDEFSQIPKLLSEAQYVKSNNIYIYDNVQISSYENINQNLSQRDFTINAIAINAKTGLIIDPYNGCQDITDKRIRAVHENIFKDDPVRIYRAARIASETGFKITPETLELMSEPHDFSSIPPERVSNELIKALKTNQPSVFFNYLKETDCLKYHFAEIQALVDVPQPIQHHQGNDAYEHTMKVLDTVQGGPAVKFAALCHDIGKGITPPEEYPHHYNHDTRGPELIDNLSGRLSGIPANWVKAAKLTAENHMKARTVTRPGKIAALYLESEKTCIGFDGLITIVNADDGSDSILSTHKDLIAEVMQSKISYPPELQGKNIGKYILQQKTMELSNQLRNQREASQRQKKLKNLASTPSVIQI